jgi:hypothetical protein
MTVKSGKNKYEDVLVSASRRKRAKRPIVGAAVRYDSAGSVIGITQSLRSQPCLAGSPGYWPRLPRIASDTIRLQPS